MIKVKIANKNGAELERELPTDIHQLYHDMREAGISRPPKNILLHDDKDVEVTLSSDSKIGNRLLRVFGKNDTLADANTVAFAVSSAREEILTDLEQNIVHNQYLIKEMLFDDIKAMTQAAGPVKLTFYCPLVGQLDDGECDEYIEVGSGFLTAYQDQIELGIADEQVPEMGDMAQYLGDNPGVADKLMPAVWTVEEIDGRLLGRIDCHLKELLTPDEMADLREEILGQCSDGLGEGFEQRPIETDEGDLYVSYWNSSDDYFLCTEDELDEHLEPHQGMGGI
ncbi:hypothetical protein I5Q82_09220 [Acutalibacter muris]|uniref:Uncharacterized protein n=1 Tax=Acutalibacter muris TaxID=1796620 RepID=A0A1Z2XVP0_9FIRM|nr:hypothetical protein [Acutalibacter muris]ANU53577.1 hypothetical protein A4V00_05760 [Hungateiclostridiaceae bacterium KB18]ANU54263.1 hypothetical protein A4V00_09660 [Hungateiclostridiaceae bacterium KB18]ASB39750.1 hypothetical protein ADH66_03215 [Acutalibacter muris]ASB42517.1 hypothetical protein ADH66_18800 [Acutalibacter muris]QQR29042.1 hypothetical protein I5Q82_13270 [Acutalibacter muris]